MHRVLQGRRAADLDAAAVGGRHVVGDGELVTVSPVPPWSKMPPA